MKQTDIAAALHAEAWRELTEHILPYWMTWTVDDRNGGFIGAITGHDEPAWEAPKGIVLNARILWTFSEAGRLLDQLPMRLLADRAYAYILAHFWDREAGGVFWMVDHTGRPLETKKLVYAQAFLLYALAAYYRCCGRAEVLERAIEVFELIERHTRDARYEGYFEVYDASWSRQPEERLSAIDPVAAKSANTQLHVLEAYAALLRLWPEERLRRRLRELVDVFLTHIVDPRTYQMKQAFEVDWTPVTDWVSFGHDIETSWLLGDAARAIGNPDLIAEVDAVSLAMVHATLAAGMAPDGSLYNGFSPTRGLDDDRHWWPQAEAVVGLLHACELTGEPAFLERAYQNWTYIQRYLVDHENGEWYFRVSRIGAPYLEEDKVGPWKCPYHTSRACFETMERTARLQEILALTP